VASAESFDLIVIGYGPAGEKAGAEAAYFGKRSEHPSSEEVVSTPAPYRAKRGANRLSIFPD
jgi:hypothetical protein